MTIEKENKINRGPKKEKASWWIEKLKTGFERAQLYVINLQKSYHKTEINRDLTKHTINKVSKFLVTQF